jgi:hypothetical protein
MENSTEEERSHHVGDPDGGQKQTSERPAWQPPKQWHEDNRHRLISVDAQLPSAYVGDEPAHHTRDDQDEVAK